MLNEEYPKEIFLPENCQDEGIIFSHITKFFYEKYKVVVWNESFFDTFSVPHKYYLESFLEGDIDLIITFLPNWGFYLINGFIFNLTPNHYQSNFDENKFELEIEKNIKQVSQVLQTFNNLQNEIRKMAYNNE